jgi:putative exosortase-associated protein (TIGR04073 family)
MKRLSITLIVMVAVAVAMPYGYAYASGTSDSYYDKVTYKLGRGITNVVGSEVEVFNGLDNAKREYGNGGFFIGTIKGVGNTIVRAVVGVGDIVTFPFVKKVHESYPLEPELPRLPCAMYQPYHW